MTSLRQRFQEAVDDYLAVCASENIVPEKPFKGSFNVRTGSDLHRRASIYAQQKNIHLNKLVQDALEKYLSA